MPQLPVVDLGVVLPPRARRVVYVAAVLVFVAVLAADHAVEQNPGWLDGALRVLDFLAPLVAGLAALNVPHRPVVRGDTGTVVDEAAIDPDLPERTYP